MSADEPRDASDHVEEWLSESGAALEMRTARAFGLGAGSDRFVDHARYYSDTDEGGRDVLREVDVVARYWRNNESGGLDSRYTIVCECKATSTPWVLYSSSDVRLRGESEFATALTYNLSYGDGVERPSISAGLSRRLNQSLDTFGHRIIEPVERHAYQVSDTSKRSGNKNPRNTAWDAVRQVLDAVRGMRREQLPERAASGRVLFSAWVPVIVTTAPLFAAYLNPAGEMVVQKVTSMPMLARMNLRFQPTTKRYLSETAALWIVHDSHVEDFANDARKSIQDLRLTFS